MEVWEKEGWRATPKVQGIIKNAFSCLGQTKIVEDGFQQERHGEAQNSSRRMALNRTWLTPIETRALSSVHRFSEPAFEAEQVPPGLANMDNKGFRHTTAQPLRCTSVTSRTCRSTSSSPPQVRRTWATLVGSPSCSVAATFASSTRRTRGGTWRSRATLVLPASVGPWTWSTSGGHHVQAVLQRHLRRHGVSPHRPVVGLVRVHLRLVGPLRIKVETSEDVSAASLFAAPECDPDSLLRVVARKAHSEHLCLRGVDV